MARNNPAAESWGAFMRSHLASSRSDRSPNRPNQADFRRRMDAAGYDISKQTVSQWANGENAPDANTVLVVAEVLGVRDTDALRAAGFDPVADRLERQGVEAGQPQGEPADPVVDFIMSLADLSMTARQTLVDEYLEEQALIRRYARKKAQRRALQVADDGDDEAGVA